MKALSQLSISPFQENFQTCEPCSMTDFWVSNASPLITLAAVHRLDIFAAKQESRSDNFAMNCVRLGPLRVY